VVKEADYLLFILIFFFLDHALIADLIIVAVLLSSCRMWTVVGLDLPRLVLLAKDVMLTASSAALRTESMHVGSDRVC
jgi:hypothetical protein